MRSTELDTRSDGIGGAEHALVECDADTLGNSAQPCPVVFGHRLLEERDLDAAALHGVEQGASAFGVEPGVGIEQDPSSRGAAMSRDDARRVVTTADLDLE